MRRFLSFLIFGLVALSSGAFIQLARDGGARQQGLDYVISYEGPLNWILPIWLFAVCAVCAGPIARRRVKIEQERISILGLLSLVCASALWSEYPLTALRTSAYVVASWLLLKTYVSLHGEERLFRTLSLSCTVIACASLMYVLLIPSYGISVDADESGRWQGVFDQKNVLGNFAALTVLLTSRPRAERVPLSDYIGGAISVILILGSQSATSLILGSGVLLLNFFANYRSAIRILHATRVAYMVGLPLLATGLVALSVSYPIVELLNRDSSFTGRNLIWAYIVFKVSAAPILGYGMDQLTPSIVNTGEFYSYVGFLVGSSHNGYLETLYYLGVTGLSLVILSVATKLIATRRDYYFLRLYGYVGFVMILNIVEARLVGFNVYFVCLLAFLIVDVGAPQRTTQRHSLSMR